MEKLTSEKFTALSANEMNEIHGGGFWKKWILVNDYCGEGTLLHSYNWFGLHGQHGAEHYQYD